MSAAQLTTEQVKILAALANGIIPADEADAGAAEVNAGPRLAEKIDTGWNVTIYLAGLALSEAIAMEASGKNVPDLNEKEMGQLIGRLREVSPAFFKLLRMDVSAMYLSDPAVWERIGFPGPSTASGGYPDFDQQQIDVIHNLKEHSC